MARPPIRVGPAGLTDIPVTYHLTTMGSQLRNIGLTNTTGNSVNVIVALVPAGAVLAIEHHILSNQPIPGHDVWERDFAITLNPGDTIQALGLGVNFRAHVQEFY